MYQIYYIWPEANEMYMESARFEAKLTEIGSSSAKVGPNKRNVA